MPSRIESAPRFCSPGFKQRALRGRLRKKLGKELKPLFTGAGLDLGRIDKVLKGNHAELRRNLTQDKAATAKQFAALTKLRLAGLANTRAALEHLAFNPYLTTPIPVATPFLIGARPTGFPDRRSRGAVEQLGQAGAAERGATPRAAARGSASISPGKTRSPTWRSSTAAPI